METVAWPQISISIPEVGMVCGTGTQVSIKMSKIIRTDGISDEIGTAIATKITLVLGMATKIGIATEIQTATRTGMEIAGMTIIEIIVTIGMAIVVIGQITKIMSSAKISPVAQITVKQIVKIRNGMTIKMRRITDAIIIVTLT